jgi:hypothetical protein
MRSIDRRLLRLEDQFGTADWKPQQHLRIVVKSLDRLPSLEGATCQRSLWPDGTLFEMVRLEDCRPGHRELTDEELDSWIKGLPVNGNASEPAGYAAIRPVSRATEGLRG